jgi:hypothetical protein
MTRSRRRSGKGGDPGQLLIDWPEGALGQPPEIPPEPAGQRPAVNARRVSARLPVPKPLPAAVAAGQFGQDDDGRPVRPGAQEVRVITERHAKKLVDLLAGIEQASGACASAEADRLRRAFDSAIAAYAEDFGEQPAQQLEAYARRLARPNALPVRR